MTAPQPGSQTERCAILTLTLLPFAASWLGMYVLKNLWWTFFLYHGGCLLPAVLWGRRRWIGAARWPSRVKWAAALLAGIVAIPLSLIAYQELGHWFIDPHALLLAVDSRGFRREMLIPLGLYFVIVNPVLEELFWRCVVENALVESAQVGRIWSIAAFAGWHYPVVRLLLKPGWSIAALFFIAAAGWLLSWIKSCSQSILVPILWHALSMDLPIMAVFAVVALPAHRM